MTARPHIDQTQTDRTGADAWEWLRDAACADADPELFFPVGDADPAAEQVKRAKEVCHGCPVESRCLEWALNTGLTSGVWGGTDEAERRRLRRNGRRKVPAQRARQASGPGSGSGSGGTRRPRTH
ncbi:WhiB family transcriptional regulator [Streptomyces sp. NPDC050433]|uniref:WhiB family transcriptional regulator n=1 Tax=unclassified Streptomyces TaxID=2593676 RepID=UPI003425FAA6